MMARPIFYNQGVKNVIVAFGSIFDEVRYLDPDGIVVKVPLGYSPKSKFVEIYTAEPDFDSPENRETLPRMGFEITGMNFAPERYHNPLSRMASADNKQFMFARIPYDFTINLYLATKAFEESLKIVEQIVPFFTPELTVTMKDSVDYNLKTDVPIILNSVGFDIVYLGSFEETRVIEWTLGFTVKAYLYSDSKATGRIKETIMNLTEEERDTRFSQLISTVVVREAERDDPHVIVNVKHEPEEAWATPELTQSVFPDVVTPPPIPGPDLA